MRFFIYNDEIVNLAHITNFICTQRHIPHEGTAQDFTLTAELDYSNGLWEKEESALSVNVPLGTFKTKDEGLQVARDIVAGKYDIPTSEEYVTVRKDEDGQTNIPTLDNSPEPEQTEPPSDEEQSKVPETPPVEEQPDDPEEKEKVIEGARELFRHLHTNAICNELNISKEKVYGEAQRMWGDSDKWDIPTWKRYIKAIANFHDRKGLIYDALKPKTTEENKEGPF